MGIEPEKVLVKDRITATFGAVKGGSNREIKQQHYRATGQGWQAYQLQRLGCQGGPTEHRHAEEGHARGPHPQNRGNEVDRPHDRGDAGQGHGKQPEALAANQVPQGVLDTDRWIGPPARVGRTTGDKKAGNQ